MEHFGYRFSFGPGNIELLAYTTRSSASRLSRNRTSQWTCPSSQRLADNQPPDAYLAAIVSKGCSLSLHPFHRWALGDDPHTTAAYSR